MQEAPGFIPCSGRKNWEYRSLPWKSTVRSLRNIIQVSLGRACEETFPDDYVSTAVFCTVVLVCAPPTTSHCTKKPH